MCENPEAGREDEEFLECSTLHAVQERPVEIPPELVLECSPCIFERQHFVPVSDHLFPYGGEFAPERGGVFTCCGRQLACLMECDSCADLNSKGKERHHETQKA